MSATLEVELFRGFFDTGTGKEKAEGPAAADGGGSPVAVVRVEGRQFPVDVLYCEEPQEDVIDAAFLATLQVGLLVCGPRGLALVLGVSW